MYLAGQLSFPASLCPVPNWDPAGLPQALQRNCLSKQKLGKREQGEGKGRCAGSLGCCCCCYGNAGCEEWRAGGPVAATQPGCQVFWRLSALRPFLPYPLSVPKERSVKHTSTAPPVENLTPKTPQEDHQAGWRSEPSNLGLILPSASDQSRGHRQGQHEFHTAPG